MKKYLFFFLFLVLSIGFSFSQKEERRVYYLDCYYSMIEPNDIWEDVCNNLIAAINAIEDETTELFVIPFAVDGSKDSCWDCYYEKATPIGKSKLRKKIKEINPSKKSMTYHSVTIKDFYNNNRVANDKITYMFLMTDGQNEEKPDLFLPELDKWKDRYGSEDVYGFYVMLDKSAKNAKVEDIISKSNDHLWKVETADVNINLIRLGDQCIYNVRNDSFVDIPILGKTENIKLNVENSNININYSIKKQEQKKDYIRLYIEPQCDVSLLPQSETMKLFIKSNGLGNFDFLVTEEITLLCENEKVKTVRPTFNKGKKIEKLGKVTYYPKFLFSAEKKEPITDTLYLNFNKDAQNNDAYAVFQFVGNDDKPIQGLHIFKDDKELVDSKFRVEGGEEKVILTFDFDPSVIGKKYQGCLKLVDYNLDQDGDTKLTGLPNDSLQWQIYYEKNMNPLKIAFLWLQFILLFAFLLWMLLLKKIFYPRFGSLTKTIYYPGMSPIVIKFKGARQVVVAASHSKKQTLWNRFWTGKIIYKVHPGFVTPVTFKPIRFKRKILVNVQNGAYRVLPNPMPGLGQSTIIDVKNNVEIIVR